MTKKITVDSACVDLAEHFLAEDPPTKRGHASAWHVDRVQALSQTIQEAVEQWLDDQARDAAGDRVDEAYERAAARDRADGFARTGGKDWT